MIDVSTATAEEVVEDAGQITKMVNADPPLSAGVLTELIKWLCAYTIRLYNDSKDIPRESQEDIQREIKRWSEVVKRDSKG